MPLAPPEQPSLLAQKETQQRSIGRPMAPQLERFKETARQLECDEDKERFEAKLKRIAKVKPEAKKEK